MRNGWRRAAFSDVVVDESGGHVKTPQREFLSEGRFAVVDQGRALIAGYVNDAARLCRAELPVIVFGDHTRCFKYVDFPFCLGADGVKVLRPKADTDVKYLYHYLRQLPLTEGGYARHFKYLKRSDVLLPPLAKQRWIAEVLDRAEALLAKRRAALAQLDTLTQAIFLELFGDPVTNPRSWPRGSLGDIAVFVGGGTPRRARPDFFDGSICWATSKDMKSEYLDDTEEHITREAIEDSATNLVPAGTILIVVKSKILAHSLPVAIARVPTCFGQDLKGIKVSESCEVVFVTTALRLGKRWLLGRARGINTEGLTLDHLKAFPLVLPPLFMQHDFARRVAAVERLKAAHSASLAEFDGLLASLKHGAFRGEL